MLGYRQQGTLLYVIGVVFGLFSIWAIITGASGYFSRSDDNAFYIGFGIFLLIVAVAFCFGGRHCYKKQDELDIKHAAEAKKRSEEQQKKAAQHQEKLNELMKWYNDVYLSLLKKYDVQKEKAVIIKVGTKTGENDQVNAIWIKEDNLYMFPHISDTDIQFMGKRNEIVPIKTLESIYVLRIIPICNIEYFKIEGEIFRETKISGGGGSGGGGGGYDVGGAIIGGIC